MPHACSARETGAGRVGMATGSASQSRPTVSAGREPVRLDRPRVYRRVRGATHRVVRGHAPGSADTHPAVPGSCVWSASAGPATSSCATPSPTSPITLDRSTSGCRPLERAISRGLARAYAVCVLAAPGHKASSLIWQDGATYDPGKRRAFPCVLAAHTRRLDMKLLIRQHSAARPDSVPLLHEGKCSFLRVS